MDCQPFRPIIRQPSLGTTTTELALAIAGAKRETKLSRGDSSGQAIPANKYERNYSIIRSSRVHCRLLHPQLEWQIG